MILSFISFLSPPFSSAPNTQQRKKDVYMDLVQSWGANLAGIRASGTYLNVIVTRLLPSSSSSSSSSLFFSAVFFFLFPSSSFFLPSFCLLPLKLSSFRLCAFSAFSYCLKLSISSWPERFLWVGFALALIPAAYWILTFPMIFEALGTLWVFPFIPLAVASLILFADRDIRQTRTGIKQLRGKMYKHKGA